MTQINTNKNTKLFEKFVDNRKDNMDLLEQYKEDYPFKEESYNIIGCAMKVHSELGNEFLEAVYQEALEIMFQENKIQYEKEKMLEITFRGKILNKKYFADFICYNEVIVELKALSELNNNHISQVLNYLKATNKKLGLLINFGSKSLEYKRVIL